MKITILPILFLAFISCRSDDNDVTVKETNPLIGIWKMDRTVTISGADNLTPINEYIPDPCKQKSTFEFQQNGKYNLNDYNAVGQECIHTHQIKNYTYLKSEDKLIIDNSESKIMELTSNTLVLYVADDYDSNNDGINDYLKYIFKK